MTSLTELQRMAEEAADEAEGDWFCPDLLGPGAPPILATTKARAFMHAMSPDTAKKLIAVALAAQKAHAEIQAFKTRWMALPPFADKINRATREGMTMAHMPIMQAEESLRTALDAIRNDTEK